MIGSILKRIRGLLPQDSWQLTRRRSGVPFPASQAGDSQESYENLREAGLVKMAEGDLESAGALLGEAMLLGYSRAEAHFNLGLVFRLIGRFEAARQAFSRALHLDSSFPKVRQELDSLPAAPPVRTDFKKGQTLLGGATGHKWTVTEVKSGGYGVVCFAREHASGKLYALKCLRAEYAWSESDRQRFEREAVIWIKLPPHPHIATAEWLERIDDQPCLVLEYVPGGDLGDLLLNGPLSPARAILLSIQFCDAMVFAHETLGLVHRDIKSSNCLLTAEGTLKVADFGLAQILALARESAMGLSGLIGCSPKVAAHYSQPMGTPSYMAPEQLLAGAVLDARTDIHAFGVMFYEMLTRDLPVFGWEAQSYIQARANHSGLSRPLIQFVLSCVDPEPRRRPVNFSDVRKELSGLLRAIARKNAPAPPRPFPLRADHWQNKAVAFQAMGLHEDALYCAGRGMEITLDDRELLLCRTAALCGLERWDEAMECCERGLSRAPHDPDFWNNRGLALRGLGRFDAALDSFGRARRFAPRDVTILKNEGEALCELQRLDEAVILFRDALTIDSGNVGLLDALGFALVAQRKPDEALDAFDKGRRISSRRFHLWEGTALAREALGQFSEAIEAYCKALEIQPEHVQVLRSRGLAYWGLFQAEGSVGRAYAERAIADFDRALQLQPDDSDAWAIRSYIAERIGRTDLAAAYRTALDKMPFGSRVCEQVAAALKKSTE